MKKIIYLILLILLSSTSFAQGTINVRDRNVRMATPAQVPFAIRPVFYNEIHRNNLSSLKMLVFDSTLTGDSSIYYTDIPSGGGGTGGGVDTIFFYLDSLIYYKNGNRYARLVPGSSGTPGGSNKQFQFNNSSSFAGSSNLTQETNYVKFLGTSTTIPPLEVRGMASQTGYLQTWYANSGNVLAGIAADGLLDLGPSGIRADAYYPGAGVAGTFKYNTSGQWVVGGGPLVLADIYSNLAGYGVGINFGASTMSFSSTYFNFNTGVLFGNTTPTPLSNPILVDAGASYGTNIPGDKNNIKFAGYHDGAGNFIGTGYSVYGTEFISSFAGNNFGFFMAGDRIANISPAGDGYFRGKLQAGITNGNGAKALRWGSDSVIYKVDTVTITTGNGVKHTQVGQNHNYELNYLFNDYTSGITSTSSPVDITTPNDGNNVIDIAVAIDFATGSGGGTVETTIVYTNSSGATITNTIYNSGSTTPTTAGGSSVSTSYTNISIIASPNTNLKITHTVVGSVSFTATSSGLIKRVVLL